VTEPVSPYRPWIGVQSRLRPVAEEVETEAGGDGSVGDAAGVGSGVVAVGDGSAVVAVGDGSDAAAVGTSTGDASAAADPTSVGPGSAVAAALGPGSVVSGSRVDIAGDATPVGVSVLGTHDIATIASTADMTARVSDRASRTGAPRRGPVDRDVVDGADRGAAGARGEPLRPSMPPGVSKPGSRVA
jgi:hypothetical protein